MEQAVLTEEELMSVNGGSWQDVAWSIAGNAAYDLLKYGLEHL